MVNCLRKYLLLLMVLFFSQKIFSQTTITGKIVDSLNNAVPYVIVLFKDNINAQPKKYCIADKNGNYIIELNNKTTTGILEFKSTNYKTLIKPFNSSNSKIKVDVKLQPIETNLPPVIVKSNNAITVNGDTTQFKVEAFKTGNEKNVGDLLNNMPGFNVQDNGKISFNGKMISKILIDNDDITGRDYGTITKNLSTNGIEDVQVINNYTDPENIISSYNNQSGLTVLNLKYKKGFLEKIFGNGDISTDFFNRYNVKLQATALFKIFKAIAFQNLNNTGDVYSNPNNQLNNSALIDKGGNSLTEINIPNQSINSTISSIQDINAPQGINPINDNSSLLSSVNFFSRLNSKLILKGGINVMNDKYNSYSNSITTYLPPYPDIVINNSERTNKYFKNFSNSLFLNYSNKKNQLGIIANYKNDNNSYGGSGELYSENYNEKLGEGKSLFAVKLIYAHIFNKTSFSTFNVQFNTQNVTGNYKLNPSFFDDFFFKNPAYNYIEQADKQSFSALSANFRYFKKIKKYSVDFNLLYNFSNNKLLNNIYSGIDNSSKIVFNGDSTNFYNFNVNNFSLKLDNNFTVSSKLKINFGVTAINYIYNYRNVFSFNKNMVKVLPFWGANFRMKNNNELYLDAYLQNNIPNLNNLGYGYEIKNLSMIQKGIDSFNFLNNYNVMIGFHHIDFTKRKLIYFLNFLITGSPLYYIGNPNVNQFFTYYNYSATDKRLNNYIITTSLQKFTNNLKYKFSYFLSYLINSSYTLNNNFDIKNSSNYIENSIQVQIKPIEKILLKLESKYAISIQKTDLSSGNKFTFKRWENKINLQYFLTKNISYLADGNYLIFYPPNNNKSNSLLINSSINFNTKNQKFSFGFKVNNLLNSSSFTQTNFSAINAVTNQINIFPRVMLGYIKVNF